MENRIKADNDVALRDAATNDLISPREKGASRIGRDQTAPLNHATGVGAGLRGSRKMPERTGVTPYTANSFTILLCCAKGACGVVITRVRTPLGSIGTNFSC